MATTRRRDRADGGHGGATAVVFDVQRFCVHDGPGIRTTVFFKGCPLRCAWCQNPESLRPAPEVAFSADRCRDAARCRAACPRGAIDGAEGRLARDRCDACGLCEPACPYGAWRVVGRRVGVDALVEEILRDRPFFDASGGGVTLSGGEPTMQMAAMGAVARACADRGVGVGVQTCGAFAWEAFAPHLPAIAFVHFDLKLIDDAAHRRWTGAGNRAILRNARRIVRAGVPVRFRMPVVPGATDSADDLDRLAAFLRDAGAPAVHLLRYHRMGQAKLPRLGFPIPAFDAGGPDAAEESLRRAAARLRAAGVEVTS